MLLRGGGRMKIQLDITWHSEDQREIYADEVRFLAIRAGRRWGKTKGAMHRMAELLYAEKPTRHLWVDTTQRNIDLYFAEHLHPILPADTYKFDQKKKVLTIVQGSIVHFGSAERPENLEGFGYDYIWCNEAGLIFKGVAGERLWNNTLRPMGMENKGAHFRFIGTPKGQGLFEEFCRRGSTDDPNWQDWKEVHRASFDRPGITEEEIDKLVAEYPGGKSSAAYRQEILAEFIGGQEEDAFIPYQIVKDALNRKREIDKSYVSVWGCDPAGHGNDVAAVCKRHASTTLEPVITNDGDLDGLSGAQWLYTLWNETKEQERPQVILIDASSWGEGWYTHGRSMGMPLRPINWAMKAANPKYHRLRDELWWKARTWLQTGSLNGDTLLMQELVRPNLSLEWQQKNIVKVESKLDMLKRYSIAGMRKHGLSPNRADAFVLTFAAGDEKKTAYENESDEENQSYKHVSWMGAW